MKSFDVGDFKSHVKYVSGYHPSQPYIKGFWDIVDNDFTYEDKSKLLKFITSVERPPLLGFSAFKPPITIQQVRLNDSTGLRLPSASTCMNLLKLPLYPSKEILREKLLYSINHNQGFGLS